MSLTLLIVDDDELDRMAVRRALRRARVDAEVDERATAEAAIEAVRAKQYDCILLDYRLPGATGVDVLTMLGNAGVRVPVVCLTGQGDEEVAVAAMKAGAADYLNKSKLTADRLERSVR
jgi:FixJ family two-component response regulator